VKLEIFFFHCVAAIECPKFTSHFIAISNFVFQSNNLNALTKVVVVVVVVVVFCFFLGCELSDSAA
jgi:hypothetical protein